MIINSISGERFNQWSKIPLSSKDDVLAAQAPLKFYANASLADNVQRVFNAAMFFIAGAKILCLIPTVRHASSALVAKAIAYIGTPSFFQMPQVATITALAPKIIATLAFIVVVRKVLAVMIYHIIYPAVVFSRENLKGLDAQRWETFNQLNALGYESKRVALNLSGNAYDAFTFEHSDTKGNGQWVIIAGGNGWVGESASKSSAPEFKDLGFNVLFVNGPRVGRSTGYPTSYSIRAAQEAGLQFLEEVTQAKKILLYGTSLGGGAQSEAIKKHHFKTKSVDYLVWSDRSFDTLSNAASSMVTNLATVAFFILGIELDGIAGAHKLKEHSITHIVTQHSEIVANDASLPLAGEYSDAGSDGVLDNSISLFVGLKKAGFRDSARLKCYGGPNVDHNGPLSTAINSLVKQDIDAFLNTPQSIQPIDEARGG